MTKRDLKYKIMLSGDEQIFHGKKFVYGKLITLEPHGRICITYTSPKCKNVPVNVYMEKCSVILGHGDIGIHGFIREKGESKYTSVYVICTPISK